MRTVYAFSAALLFSLAITPTIRWIAKKTGAMVYPNSRSVHRKPVPHLGGVAIYLASVASMLIFPPDDRVAMYSVILGGLIMLIVGTIDDIKDLTPIQKLIGQVISALVVIWMGISISFITNPFTGAVTMLGFLAVPLTVGWVVSFENLVNLADGLDGLAAGVSGITALVMVFAANKAGATGISTAAAALAGSVLGFLPLNFHPASIFMGDGGALYIGLALSVLSVQGFVKSAVFMSVLAPILAMMVPISDAAFAIIRRGLAGTGVARADRDHLHHRLLELGMSQRQAVLIIYVVSLGFGALGMVSSFVPLRQGGPLAALAILGTLVVAQRVGLLTVTAKSKGRSRSHNG